MSGQPRRHFAILPLVVAVILTCVSGASAHGLRPSGPAEGIRIPSLTHGQMAVLASYRGEIMDLAALYADTDQAFQRVTNYANIQHSICMWGIVPRSITDETSPFNECSHAYLAATMMVLQRMQDMPGPHPRVDDLASRIDMDMVRHQASLVLCQYSDEAFYTGTVIHPNWPDVPGHPPSLMAFGAFGLFTIGMFGAVARATRTGSKKPDA